MKMPRVTNTIEEISYDYDKAKKNHDVFYAQSFLNRNGCLIDNDKKKATISNQIADWMLGANPLLCVKEIPMPEGMTYLIPWHSGEPTTQNLNSNREEELVAMTLSKKDSFDNSDIDGFVDYQVPIYRGHEFQSEHIGKIDLVSISHKEKKIYLMELKKYASKETLLRCVCECYTYFKQISKERLKREIVGQDKADDYEVVPAVLVFKYQHQHQQYESELYDKVKELIASLGVAMFVIDSPLPFESGNYREYIEQCTITEVSK